MIKMKLIAFTGQMGSGKSTAVSTLREFADNPVHNIKFAQTLYDIQNYIYERIESVYKRPEDFIKDRKLLQWIGTEWGRGTISESLWVDTGVLHH
jgi:dephospho-CoA kinase